MIKSSKIAWISLILSISCMGSLAFSGCTQARIVERDGTDTVSEESSSVMSTDTEVELETESYAYTEKSSDTEESEIPLDTESDTKTESESSSEEQASEESSTCEATESEETTDSIEDTTYPEPQAGTDILHIGFGENKDYVVVIDAGHQRHGMTDKEPNGPGSDVMKAKVSSGTYGRFTNVPEYELNLAVALTLRDELMSRGYTVVMVRETHDVEVSNVGRAQIANKYAPSEENGYKYTINVRIHANGSDNASSNGALMCSPTSSNPYKIGELFDECLALANAIIDPYCASTGIKKRPSHIQYGDNMTGTNWCEVPTTILEMGFMTNEGDDRLMQSEGFNENAALGIANGIDAFFEAYR